MPAEGASKNKKLLIGVAVVVLLIVAGAGIFFLSGRNEAPEEEVGIAEENLPKMSPSEIGLEITPSSDQRYIQFTVTKLSGIKHLEWEFTYDADAPADLGDGEGGRVTQGFGGEADVEGESEYTSEKRELGTCSTGGKCRFDTGIEKVALLIKVTKDDGTVYQVEDSISL